MNDQNVLLTKLINIRDFCFENGANPKNVTEYGDVMFYDNGGDNPYCSVEYKGVEVAFDNDRISEITIKDVETWGINLYLWADKALDVAKKAVENEYENREQDIQEESYKYN